MCDAIIRYYRDEVVLPALMTGWGSSGDSGRDGTFPMLLVSYKGNTSLSDVPEREESLLHYKRFPSLVMFGLVDVDYKSICFDISSYGSSSDSEIFLYSALRQKIEDSTIGSPPAESLFDHVPQAEYLFVDDNTFPL